MLLLPKEILEYIARFKLIILYQFISKKYNILYVTLHQNLHGT